MCILYSRKQPRKTFVAAHLGFCLHNALIFYFHQKILLWVAVSVSPSTSKTSVNQPPLSFLSSSTHYQDPKFFTFPSPKRKMKTIPPAPLSNAPNTTPPRIGKQGGKLVQVATCDWEQRLCNQSTETRNQSSLPGGSGLFVKRKRPQSPGTWLVLGNQRKSGWQAEKEARSSGTARNTQGMHKKRQESGTGCGRLEGPLRLKPNSKGRRAAGTLEWETALSGLTERGKPTPGKAEIDPLPNVGIGGPQSGSCHQTPPASLGAGLGAGPSSFPASNGRPTAPSVRLRRVRPDSIWLLGERRHRRSLPSMLRGSGGPTSIPFPTLPPLPTPAAAPPSPKVSEWDGQMEEGL